MDQQHLVNLLRQGEIPWNQWRADNPQHVPDLRRAELQGSLLMGCNLSGADLREVRLAWAELRNANFRGADLRGVLINDARAAYADFSGSKLQDAYLWGSDFREAVFRDADLSGANLMCSQLIGADFTGANLTGCLVYGTSAWDIKLEGAIQEDLIITPPNTPAESRIVVDDMEVAQFIYLLLDNANLRRVIDTVTSKAVLILGSFSEEQLATLMLLKGEIRRLGYLPLLFDFRGPDRELDETVRTLAGMSRFIIVDLTNAKSVLQELRGIVPDFPSVPVQPLILSEQSEPGMLAYFRRFPWFLATIEYDDQRALADKVNEIIQPADTMATEIKADLKQR